MKTLSLPVGFAVLASVPTMAFGTDVQMAAIMRTNKLSAVEAAAVVVIADALGVDADFVIRTGKSTGQPPSIYGPAMIYAYECKRPFKDVWKERNKGWGNVAHSIGMHPGTFNQYRKKGYSVDEIIWMNSLNRGYRISPTQYSGWRGEGFSRGSILEVSVRWDGNTKKMRSDFDKRKSSSTSKSKSPSKGKSPTKGKSGSKGKGSGKGPGKGKGKG